MTLQDDDLPSQILAHWESIVHAQQENLLVQDQQKYRHEKTELQTAMVQRTYMKCVVFSCVLIFVHVSWDN